MPLYLKRLQKNGDLIPVKDPDQNTNSEDDVEVGDVHQPLKHPHLLLWCSKPLFRFSLEIVGHLFYAETSPVATGALA